MILRRTPVYLSNSVKQFNLNNMENGNNPIYPDPMRGAEQSFTNQSPYELPTGLTKREYFAGLAMNEFIAYGQAHISFEACAADSVKMADALLKELDKPKND